MALAAASRFGHALTAELTKIRTLRSTGWALLLTPLTCAGVGYGASLSLRLSFSRLPAAQQRDFDPLFATFYGLTIGQLALVVFGVLVVGSEYSSGMITASLAVVPRRALFYAAKMTAGGVAAAAAALVTVTVTFFVTQQALGTHRISPGALGVPQAALGACLYLTLICVFAMGITAMLRNQAAALAIMLPPLLLDSQGLGNVPGLQRVVDYLPDQADAVIVHLTGAPGSGRFARPYGPWPGMAIMAAEAAAVLIGGYLVLARTDVSGTRRRPARSVSG